MSAQENAATARAFSEAYNARDWDAAIALTTPDANLVNVATGETFHGPDGVRRFLDGWATAFPDSTVDTTWVVADEQGAAMEFRGRGTQSGPLRGPAGEIPPTGKAIEVLFAEALEFQQGKIAQARLYFDLAGMLGQLGLMPTST